MRHLPQQPCEDRGSWLSTPSISSSVGPHAEVLEKAVRRVRAGLMPPAGARRPDAATLTSLAEGMEASLDRAAATPNLVAPGLHRMNRTEYANAIRELLGWKSTPPPTCRLTIRRPGSTTWRPG